MKSGSLKRDGPARYSARAHRLAQQNHSPAVWTPRENDLQGANFLKFIEAFERLLNVLEGVSWRAIILLVILSAGFVILSVGAFCLVEIAEHWSPLGFVASVVSLAALTVARRVVR